MRGGDDLEEWGMFTRGQQAAFLSGFLIGFALVLGTIANALLADVMFREALVIPLCLGSALLAHVYRYRSRFASGALSSFALMFSLFVFDSTMSLVQRLVNLPFLGGVLFAMILTGGILLTRS